MDITNDPSRRRSSRRNGCTGLRRVPATGPASTGAVALQCGKLFDARSGQLLDTRTVVVRDGKIVEVLAGRADVPGATAIDLSGHTCTPGWTDLHVHLGSQSSPKSYEEDFRLDDVDFAFRSVDYAKKTLLAGFTSVRDLGGDVARTCATRSTRAWSTARASGRRATRSPPPAATAIPPTATTPSSRT